tara:strand:- start:42 stop:326 length:285 start_codon:yes stop_codon:yes gene_type:complete
MAPRTPNKRPSEIIDLQYPVSIDGTEVLQLSMRRPTVRDQILFEDGKGSDARKIVKMLSNLCEVSDETIMELDQSDFLKLSEVLQGFQDPQSEK